MAVKQKTNHYIRFKWDFHEDYYFEFKIVKQELTGDVSLIVTDYADADDYVGTVELWNLQVRKLKNAIGCAKKL
ncbi:hypothetical protein BN938_0016 [Mucinivorans hirudinis]|uniref:START-like domain-containing protein n=1 Tax=Mucinivorans hirudinis TaxID=1433126 RepID=A0A060R8P6_9BACT|nr:hypothetical protein BN938_0016 [Mucinivorans hirudinis]